MNPPSLTKNVAILLCGGKGTRFGSPFPKQFHKLGGKPIYLHSLEALLKSQKFQLIILPIPIESKALVEREISLLFPKKNILVIPGGKTRQESSYIALQACPKNTEYVLIHDAVRPFVSEKILEDNLSQVVLHKAVDTCITSADTLVYSKMGSFIDSIPRREEFLRGQTPQTFSWPLIMEAHQKALEQNITNSSDDCSLILNLGYPVAVVQGNEYNLKITTDFDLFLAEQILFRPKIEEITSENSLEGKIFAVTGASGGIGQALCLELSKQGAIPLEISQTASFLQADLTDYQQVQKLFAEIEQKYGPLDGLINGIGTLHVKDFEQLSEAEIKETIDANLMSIIYCCRSARIKKGGHIINISSSSYSRGRKDHLIYSASKAAVVNFTQGLADARPDLHVNVVVPQRTDTPLRRKEFPCEDPASLLQPKEIADKISRLLQSSSSGTILEIRKKYTLPES